MPSSPPAPDVKSEDGSAGDSKDSNQATWENTIDSATFEQILEMDDDEEDREFSRSIVYDFFQQAETTFQKMDKALADNDLGSLSSLGHFLKGSSATLGLTKVKDSCEKIQHLGARKDETGTNDEPNDDVSLRKLKTIIKQAKGEFNDAERLLRQFFHDDE